METIMFKAPVGTKAKLRAINPNISALLREQTERLLSGPSGFRSAHDKAKHLMFRSGRRDAATSKDYLKQYAQKTIADAGLVVAYLDEDEAHHDWAVQMFLRFESFCTCEAVLAEVCARLNYLGVEPWRAIRLVNEDILRIDFDMGIHANRIEQLMIKYRDLPMDFADACLVAMTEKVADSLVVTLDVKDFSVYRRHERQVVPFLAPRK